MITREAVERLGDVYTGMCGSVGEAERGSRVMFRCLRKRAWRFERMAAGVPGRRRG